MAQPLQAVSRTHQEFSFREDAVATKKLDQSRKSDQEVVRVRPRADRRTSSRGAPNETDIARRAYQLFVQRGGEHGHDWEDWLRAERELMSQL
jgi:hypothetical protein